MAALSSCEGDLRTSRGRSLPSPFPSTEAGAGRAAGKRVSEESGLLCVSGPNIRPETSPDAARAPVRSHLPTSAPFASLPGPRPAPVRLGRRAPPSGAWQEGDGCPECFPRWTLLEPMLVTVLVTRVLQPQTPWKWLGWVSPSPPPEAATIYSRDTEESRGPSSQFCRGGCGLGGAQRPPRMLAGVGRLSRAPVDGTSQLHLPEEGGWISPASAPGLPPPPPGRQSTSGHSWGSLFIDQTLGGYVPCGS